MKQHIYVLLFLYCFAPNALYSSDFSPIEPPPDRECDEFQIRTYAKRILMLTKDLQNPDIAKDQKAQLETIIELTELTDAILAIPSLESLKDGAFVNSYRKLRRMTLDYLINYKKEVDKAVTAQKAFPGLLSIHPAHITRNN